MNHTVEPEVGWSVYRIGGERDGEGTVGQRRRAGRKTLKGSAVAEPLPFLDLTCRNAEAVIALDRGMRLAPLRADHLAPAGGRQHATNCGRIELREKTGEVASGADKPGCRRQRVGRIVPQNHDLPAERQLAAVAMRDRRGSGEGHIRVGFIEPDRLDDLAPDPAAIRLSGHRFNDETGQAVTVVRVFKAGIGLDDRRRRQIGAQLRFVEEWTRVLPLAAVGAIADDAGAVREQLGDRRLRNRRVKALHILTGAVVETELALFAKLHDAGSGETLGMRRDTKTMTWRQRRLADNIGTAEGPFEDDPAIMHNRNDAPRLLGLVDLIFEPAWDVIERG